MEQINQKGMVLGHVQVNKNKVLQVIQKNRDHLNFRDIEKNCEINYYIELDNIKEILSCQLLIMVFNLNSLQSFDFVKLMYIQLKDQIKTNTIKCLLGINDDQTESEVEYDEILDYCVNMGFIEATVNLNQPKNIDLLLRQIKVKSFQNFQLNSARKTEQVVVQRPSQEEILRQQQNEYELMYQRQQQMNREDLVEKHREDVIDKPSLKSSTDTLDLNHFKGSESIKTNLMSDSYNERHRDESNMGDFNSQKLKIQNMNSVNNQNGKTNISKFNRDMNSSRQEMPSLPYRQDLDDKISNIENQLQKIDEKYQNFKSPQQEWDQKRKDKNKNGEKLELSVVKNNGQKQVVKKNELRMNEGNRSRQMLNSSQIKKSQKKNKSIENVEEINTVKSRLFNQNMNTSQKNIMVLSISHKNIVHEFKVYQNEGVDEIIQKVITRLKLKKRETLVENIRIQLNQQLYQIRYKLEKRLEQRQNQSGDENRVVGQINIEIMDQQIVLNIKQNDDPRTVAEQFVQKHKLAAAAVPIIMQQIQSVKSV